MTEIFAIFLNETTLIHLQSKEKQILHYFFNFRALCILHTTYIYQYILDKIRIEIISNHAFWGSKCHQWTGFKKVESSHLCRYVVTGWNLDLHLKRQIDMLEEKKVQQRGELSSQLNLIQRNFLQFILFQMYSGSFFQFWRVKYILYLLMCFLKSLQASKLVPKG